MSLEAQKQFETPPIEKTDVPENIDIKTLTEISESNITNPEIKKCQESLTKIEKQQENIAQAIVELENKATNLREESAEIETEILDLKKQEIREQIKTLETAEATVNSDITSKITVKGEEVYNIHTNREEQILALEDQLRGLENKTVEPQREDVEMDNTETSSEDIPSEETVKTETFEANSTYIQEAEDFDELYSAIANTEGIQPGFSDLASGKYGAAGYKWIIEKIRNEKENLQAIPEGPYTDVIRFKVMELLNREPQNSDTTEPSVVNTQPNEPETIMVPKPETSPVRRFFKKLSGTLVEESQQDLDQAKTTEVPIESSPVTYSPDESVISSEINQEKEEVLSKLEKELKLGPGDLQLKVREFARTYPVKAVDFLRFINTQNVAELNGKAVELNKKSKKITKPNTWFVHKNKDREIKITFDTVGNIKYSVIEEKFKV